MHNVRVGVLEFLILPFAVIHNPPGIFLLTITIFHFLVNTNAVLLGLEEPTRVEKLQATVNFMIHVICVLITTTIQKKIFNRPRPNNPNLCDSNRRYLNLRGHENNASMPSGDTT